MVARTSATLAVLPQRIFFFFFGKPNVGIPCQGTMPSEFSSEIHCLGSEVWIY